MTELGHVRKKSSHFHPCRIGAIPCNKCVVIFEGTIVFLFCCFSNKNISGKSRIRDTWQHFDKMSLRNHDRLVAAYVCLCRCAWIGRGRVCDISLSGLQTILSGSGTQHMPLEHIAAHKWQTRQNCMLWSTFEETGGVKVQSLSSWWCHGWWRSVGPLEEVHFCDECVHCFTGYCEMKTRHEQWSK